MVTSSSPLKAIGEFTRSLTLGFHGINRGACKLDWTLTIEKGENKRKIYPSEKNDEHEEDGGRMALTTNEVMLE